ncbi:trypsin-like serine protease [Neoconidiobolus thromboides FSU 785]|nr:trypsin-like serine protease [Neoconidiobolus thromboides FSU 785]
MKFTTKLLVGLQVLNYYAQTDNSRSSDTPQARIIGGEKVSEPWKYPFMVSLKKSNFHLCGGTLLNQNQVITAAHCTGTVDKWTVTYGINDLTKKEGEESYSGVKVEVRKVAKIVRHPDYNGDTDDNDVAVWTLDSPFKNFKPSIKLNEDANIYNKKVLVLGWGFTAEGQDQATRFLNQAFITLFPQSQCKDLYKNMKLRSYDSKKHLCAGELTGAKDACQGDSGGPLILADTMELVGITSYGIGCGRKERPGIYTNLLEYSAFIKENLMNNNTDKPSESIQPSQTTQTIQTTQSTQSTQLTQTSKSTLTAAPTATKPKPQTAFSTQWFTMGPRPTRINDDPWRNLPNGWEVRTVPLVQAQPTYYYPQQQPQYYYYYY